jgi:hypothetical protein
MLGEVGAGGKGAGQADDTVDSFVPAEIREAVEENGLGDVAEAAAGQ